MTSPLTIPVAVDIVALTVIDHTLHALVVRRGIEPFKDHLALPGGFLREGEQTEEAAARELEEETGITPPGHLEQLRSYGPEGRDRAGQFSPSPTSSSPPRSHQPKREADAAGTVWHPVDALLAPSHPRLRPRTDPRGRRGARPFQRVEYSPLGPHPSAAPSSRSHSCAPHTKPSGDRRSTRAIFIAKQQKPHLSSSQREARCARVPGARPPSTASSRASMLRPSSSTHPCAAHPLQPRPRQ